MTATITSIRLRQAFLIICVALLCAAAFMYGELTVLRQRFPGPLLSKAYRGFIAQVYYRKLLAERYSHYLWKPSRFNERGVTRRDTALMAPGLTLYTSSHSQCAVLIDNAGNVLHEWHIPYSSYWESSSAVVDPRPEHQAFWFAAQAFEDGSLMAVVEGTGNTPWGQGIIKIDRESNIIWKFLERAHHDFSVGHDGRVYCLTHEIIQRDTTFSVELEFPCLDDYLIVLSPDGKKVRQISLLRAIANSRFSWLLANASITRYGEYLHANAARVVTAAVAAHAPMLKEGQVIVSLRSLSAIIAVDIDSGLVTEVFLGSWSRQHDPDMLETGTMLLFDNLGNPEGIAGVEGSSRVIEVRLSDLAVVHQYNGSARDGTFESVTRSCQQRLTNGNTLITESDAGRLREVTVNSDIVWEYINPVRGGARGELIPIFGIATRLSPDFFEPEFSRRLRTVRTDGHDVPGKE